MLSKRKLDQSTLVDSSTEPQIQLLDDSSTVTSPSGSSSTVPSTVTSPSGSSSSDSSAVSMPVPPVHLTSATTEAQSTLVNASTVPTPVPPVPSLPKRTKRKAGVTDDLLLQTLPLQTPLEAAEQIRFSDTDYGADTTRLPPSGLSSFDQSIDASTVPPEHLTLVDSSTVPVPVPTVHLTSATEAQLLEDSPSCRSGLSSLPVPVPTTSPSGSSSTVPSTKVKRPRLKAGVPGDLPLLTSPLQTLTFQTPSQAAEQI